MSRIVIYCDGLVEPVNPGGIACYGWVAYRGGERLGRGSAVVCSGPNATNNVAEYSAVIAGLEWLLSQGFAGEEIAVRSDSQLCIYQLSGRYAVHSERLRPLFRRARRLASQFKKVRFEWVPRKKNAEADALSREAYASVAFVEGQGKREEKARMLLPLVEHLGGSFYAVPSQSEPGRVYEVDLRTRRCSCPDFAARWRSGLKCKHLLAAEMAAAGRGEAR